MYVCNEIECLSQNFAANLKNGIFDRLFDKIY